MSYQSMNPDRRTFIDRYGRLTIDLPDAIAYQVAKRWVQVRKHRWPTIIQYNTVDALVDNYVPWEHQTSDTDTTDTDYNDYDYEETDA